MADFSKQFNTLYHHYPTGTHDFDFEEEFNQLNNNEQLALICEGFGTTGICKTGAGVRMILLDDEWIDYDGFILNQMKKNKYNEYNEPRLISKRREMFYNALVVSFLILVIIVCGIFAVKLLNSNTI